MMGQIFMLLLCGGGHDTPCFPSVIANRSTPQSDSDKNNTNKTNRWSYGQIIKDNTPYTNHIIISMSAATAWSTHLKL